MSLRHVALLDVPRGEAPLAWLERLELLEFHGGLQLSVLQVVSPELPCEELWISRACRRPQELTLAFSDWAQARNVGPALIERAMARARETLGDWGLPGLREPATVPSAGLRLQRNP